MPRKLPRRGRRWKEGSDPPAGSGRSPGEPTPQRLRARIRLRHGLAAENQVSSIQCPAWEVAVRVFRETGTRDPPPHNPGEATGRRECCCPTTEPPDEARGPVTNGDAHQLPHVLAPHLSLGGRLCVQRNPEQAAEQHVEAFHAGAEGEKRAVYAGLDIIPEGRAKVKAFLFTSIS